MYTFSVSVVTIFAITDVLGTFKIELNVIDSSLSFLPLYENGLGWAIPTLLAAVIGYALDLKWKKVVDRSKI